MAEWILSSSVLILILILLRALLKGRIAPGLQYALWLIVLLRLLIPVSPFESKISVAGMMEAAGETGAVVYVLPEPVSLPQEPSAAPAAAEPEPPLNSGAAAPAATDAEEKAYPSLPTGPMLYALWLLGSAFVLFFAGLFNHRLGNRLRAEARPLPGKWSTPPRQIYISPASEAPCLFGLLSPAVYVPEAIALNDLALGHVLSHERAHYRHGDPIWSLLRLLVLALHWYNPLVWWACVLSKRDAETAADASAIAALGEKERADYGKTLIGLLARSSRPADLLSCGTAMYGSKRTVKERVRLIAKKPKTAVLSLVLVMLVCAIAVRLTYTGSGGGKAPAAADLSAPFAAVPEPVGTADGIPKTLAAEPVKPVYVIPESAERAPKPNPSLFGSTSDPGDILALIDTAAELFGGQSPVFDPDADFQPGKEIQYYCDETILVITWKEIIDGKCCTFSEVKLADGSQLRRKLAGDRYGSELLSLASDLAASANAVVALNGDFHAFRNTGITVYQRQLYRCEPDLTDTCFFTASGDMLLSYAGELSSPEEVQQYLEENDVVFSLAFGPVLVDNSRLRTVAEYPVGEVNSRYSRTCIGQLGQLHYLLMTVNYDEGYTVTATIQDAARFMYDKGCVKAYALDGGQTSELLMEGKPVNHIDFGAEREISDILYFGTALPETE